MMKQYLHVHCQQFALFVEADLIEEVVPIVGLLGDHLQWREQSLAIVNLSKILSGHAVDDNRDCLIFTDSRSADDAKATHFIALAVGSVSNIESIDERQFASIPSLDFLYNRYFDKAYIHPISKQCVYRLRRTAFSEISHDH